MQTLDITTVLSMATETNETDPRIKKKIKKMQRNRVRTGKCSSYLYAVYLCPQPGFGSFPGKLASSRPTRAFVGSLLAKPMEIKKTF